VNALERDLGAMQCLVRERGLMVLAMNTRDAVASEWIVAVKLKTCCKRILDNQLNLIASNNAREIALGAFGLQALPQQQAEY
jgi:hypothetical protein